MILSSSLEYLVVAADHTELAEPFARRVADSSVTPDGAPLRVRWVGWAGVTATLEQLEPVELAGGERQLIVVDLSGVCAPRAAALSRRADLAWNEGSPPRRREAAMQRLTFSASAVLLTALVFSTTVACEASSEDPVATAVATPEAAPRAPRVTNEAPAAPAPVALPELDDQPVLASANISTSSIAATNPIDPAPALETEPKLERRPRGPDSLRSPSLIPAGTPEANIVAFTELPIAKRDKAPVGGVGATGVHLDELEVGKAWASSRCAEPSRSFSAGVDDRVSVCFRVVHPREAEAVTVEWARDGKLRQSIELGVPATHSYLTRAWLPVSEGRAGAWTATVKSEDGAVLGQIEFEITK